MINLSFTLKTEHIHVSQLIAFEDISVDFH